MDKFFGMKGISFLFYRFESLNWNSIAVTVMLYPILYETISKWHFNKLLSMHTCFSICWRGKGIRKVFLLWTRNLEWLVGWFYHLPILAHVSNIEICFPFFLLIHRFDGQNWQYTAELLIRRAHKIWSEFDSIWMWINCAAVLARKKFFFEFIDIQHQHNLFAEHESIGHYITTDTHIKSNLYLM